MSKDINEIKVTVIAPNNCSPDYRIIKSFDMIKKLNDNAKIIRLVDRNSRLNHIDSCHDIEISALTKSVEALSPSKFKTTFNFSVWLFAYFLNFIDQMAHVFSILPVRCSLNCIRRRNNKSNNKIAKSFPATSEEKIFFQVKRFEKMLSNSQKK